MAAEEHNKRVSLYKASAGSGKTFTLVLEYLGIVLRRPSAYRSILAITFTNKAAGEMKDRILSSLSDLAAHKPSRFLQPLLQSTALPEDLIRARAGEALSLILHDYGNFAVSTIDAFTYRLIRSFSRDLGLPGRFEVELDTEGLIHRVTDQLMDAAGRDPYITRMLTQYAEEKLQDDESWNIEADIRGTAEHLFREGSKDSVERLQAVDQERFIGFIAHMRELMRSYEETLLALATEAHDLVLASGIPVSHFAHGRLGFVSALAKLRHRLSPGDYDAVLQGRLRQAVLEDEWASSSAKAGKAAVENLADNGLRRACAALIQHHDTHYSAYLDAVMAYSNIYSLALMRQMEDLLAAHKERHQMVHISDFQRSISDFLSQEAPDYIYWRLGERFRHFLLDEFQDTSQVQWQNLSPLLHTIFSDDTTPGSLLIVGDSKQAIYRWRGGDVDLMEHTVPAELGVEPVSLGTNHRSLEEVVTFNNQFFTSLSQVMAHNDGVSAIYQDFEQAIREGNEGNGYVEIRFLDQDEHKFKAAADEAMLATVAQLLTQHYTLGDIAVLVRTRDHGNLAAETLSKAGHRVISAESLLLTAEPAINFIISLLRFLNDPTHQLARAEVLHYYFTYVQQRPDPAMAIREILEDEKPWSLILAQLPEEVRKLRNRMDQLPLYEMAEEIIRIFSLGGDNARATGYLQHFLDVILNYAERNKPDIQGFLDHWEDHKHKATVKVPEHEDAIRILTIHKSKGLEFPVVIIPYADWSFMPSNKTTLWTEGDTTVPGEESGEDGTQPLLVPFHKALQKSGFEGAYEDEVRRSELDHVNMLYVAFTRAEERLYILSPALKKVKEDAKEMGKVHEWLRAVADRLWPDRPESDRVERGIPIPRMERTSYPPAPAPLWVSERWRDRIRVERKFHRYRDLFTADAHEEGTPFLVVVREALRQMNLAKEVDHTLTTLKEQGLLTEERTPTLRTKLDRLLHHTDLGPWYQPNGRVPLTAEIVTPEGELIRPDKMYRTHEGVKVLQFTQANWLQEDREMLTRLAQETITPGETLQAWLFHLDSEVAERVL